jgi:hypothetical protein
MPTGRNLHFLTYRRASKLQHRQDFGYLSGNALYAYERQRRPNAALHEVDP